MESLQSDVRKLKREIKREIHLQKKLVLALTRLEDQIDGKLATQAYYEEPQKVPSELHLICSMLGEKNSTGLCQKFPTLFPKSFQECQNCKK